MRVGTIFFCSILTGTIAAFGLRVNRASLPYRSAAGKMLLAADGHANESIAKTLHLGIGTVKGHVVAILRKLGVSNRAAAIARIVRSPALNGGIPH